MSATWRQWLQEALGLSDRPQGFPLKTHGAQLRRTVCCFCSCGCGMVGSVRDGKLLALEGDARNPINEGTLCSKGAAAAQLHTAPDRLTHPMRRAPGGRDFAPIPWDEALDRVTAAIRRARDSSWKVTESYGGRDVSAARTDALAFLGGAINTNEEAYLFRKLATLLGSHCIEHQARI